jgi:hypothetical protein
MNSKFSHSGNIILAGFAMMIIFMSYLVFRCINQPAEMVNDNYYENELKYQDNINAKVNGDVYMQSFAITIHGSKIILKLPIELTNNFTSASVIFYCVSDKSADIKILLQNSSDGIYYFDASTWKKLNFIAKISIVSGGKKYFHEMTIQL